MLCVEVYGQTAGKTEDGGGEYIPLEPLSISVDIGFMNGHPQICTKAQK